MAAAVTPRPRRHGDGGGTGLRLPGAGAAGGGRADGRAADGHAPGEEEDGRGAGPGRPCRQRLQHPVGRAGGRRAQELRWAQAGVEVWGTRVGGHACAGRG